MKIATIDKSILPKKNIFTNPQIAGTYQTPVVARISGKISIGSNEVLLNVTPSSINASGYLTFIYEV